MHKLDKSDIGKFSNIYWEGNEQGVDTLNSALGCGVVGVEYYKNGRHELSFDLEDGLSLVADLYQDFAEDGRFALCKDYKGDKKLEVGMLGMGPRYFWLSLRGHRPNAEVRKILQARYSDFMRELRGFTGRKGDYFYLFDRWMHNQPHWLPPKPNPIRERTSFPERT